MSAHYHETPQPSRELKVLDSLKTRTNLSPKDQLRYNNLKKGYAGEQQFYHFLKNNLTINHILLNGLQLSSNNSEIQIDSLLICADTIYHFEVKNFEGDFYIQRNNWHVLQSGKEINNPIIQLKRSESLLRQLIHHLSSNFQIKSYIVFVNPEFALLQAPVNFPVILPAQLNRFVKELNANPSPLKNHHQRLADFLIGRHIVESSNERLPKYSFDQLRKGIRCKSCSGFMSYLNIAKLICHCCKSEVRIEIAVMKNVEKFQLLFPNKKITTSLIYEWCAVIPSIKTIRRILSNYLLATGTGRATQYVYKDKIVDFHE